MKKKNKQVWHYAVMISVFGDYWIAKTKSPLKKEVVFSDLEEAKEKARMLFEDAHPDFDIEVFDNEEEGNSLDLENQYRNIIEAGEYEKIEVIDKKMEKHIVE